MKNKTEKTLLLLKFITIAFISFLSICAIINEIQKI